MTDKYFVSPQLLLEDSYRLAQQVLNSGFRPDYLVAVWRGGTPIGAAVHEIFKYHQVNPVHHVIGTNSYEGKKRKDPVDVWGLEFLVNTVNSEDSILWIDDVYESGLSLKAALGDYKQLARKNTSQDQRIATVHWKPSKNKSGRDPDFFVHKEKEDWINYPHD